MRRNKNEHQIRKLILGYVMIGLSKIVRIVVVVQVPQLLILLQMFLILVSQHSPEGIDECHPSLRAVLDDALVNLVVLPLTHIYLNLITKNSLPKKSSGHQPFRGLSMSIHTISFSTLGLSSP